MATQRGAIAAVQPGQPVGKRLPRDVRDPLDGDIADLTSAWVLIMRTGGSAVIPRRRREAR